MILSTGVTVERLVQKINKNVGTWYYRVKDVKWKEH